jgi:sec-independent protein translocase protein TatB
MPDIGWTELLLIAVVAIVVIGPKDLPRAMRLVGQWTAKMKRMARDFQGQFNEALREAELDGVKKDIEAVGKDIEKVTKVDPVADVRREMTKTSEDIRKGLDTPAAAKAAEETSATEEKPASAAEATPAPAAAEVAVAPTAPSPAAAAGDAKP